MCVHASLLLSGRFVLLLVFSQENNHPHVFSNHPHENENNEREHANGEASFRLTRKRCGLKEKRNAATVFLLGLSRGGEVDFGSDFHIYVR